MNFAIRAARAGAGIGDRSVELHQPRFGLERANLMFWEHQGEAQVTWMNVELKCKERK